MNSEEVRGDIQYVRKCVMDAIPLDMTHAAIAAALTELAALFSYRCAVNQDGIEDARVSEPSQAKQQIVRRGEVYLATYRSPSGYGQMTVTAKRDMEAAEFILNATTYVQDGDSNIVLVSLSRIGNND